MKNYLFIEKIGFRYAQSDKPALQDITFSVRQGDFVTICGGTGSGKTTLLRLFKPELIPKGERTGSILWNDMRIDDAAPFKSTCAIGYVMQKPEQQIVTDTVWHELAFGLENMHMPPAQIASRIAETASYFGITDWYEQKTDTLSGGQKQLLNLAAVMTMHPEILILDEPTAQLDPIAAAEFMAALERLHRDLSLTILLSEHCLEEVLPRSDRLLVLERGRLLTYDTPRAAISEIQKKPELLREMPAAVRLGIFLGEKNRPPLTIGDGRNLVAHYRREIQTPPPPPQLCGTQIALEMRNIRFRYAPDAPDVLRDVSLIVRKQEIFCLLGGNASGKTTLLTAAARLLKPQSGTVFVFGKKLKAYHSTELYRNCLSMLPQDVQTIFLKDTVREEWDGVTDFPFLSASLLDQHPYDLSGGEQQMAALGKVLRQKPRLLLLDEPSKGMDADAKCRLAQLLKQWRKDGMTILFTTHDIDFAGECADRCALMFRGQIVSDAQTPDFMEMHRFYTTAANRMTRGIYKNVVTVEEAAALCQKNGRFPSEKDAEPICSDDPNGR